MTHCVQYQQWGNKQARQQVIFLHGWGMNSGVWQPSALFLEQQFPEFNILAVDLPGYGYSRNCERQTLGGRYDCAALAQSLAFLLTDKQSIIIAWSMGGLVALDLVQQYPQAVRQLILVSSSPRFVQGDDWPYAVKAAVFEEFYHYLEQDHQTALKRFLLIQAMGSDTARKDIKILQQQLQQRGQADPDALKYGLEMLLTEDKRQQLSAISHIPVALIGGQRDSLVHIKAQQQLSQQENIKLYSIAGAGHAPFISHADEFMSLLRGLLEH